LTRPSRLVVNSGKVYLSNEIWLNGLKLLVRKEPTRLSLEQIKTSTPDSCAGFRRGGVKTPTALEICAGGGGQALGLEQAGFAHVGLVEVDEAACETLKANRPLWNVIQADINDIDGVPYQGIDLLAGGIPCPPFSIAGKQLGSEDERNLFPAVIRLTKQIRPSIMQAGMC